MVRVWNDSFNPTLVRLRPASSDMSELVKSTFQSHAGSIEAHLEQK